MKYKKELIIGGIIGLILCSWFYDARDYFLNPPAPITISFLGLVFISPFITFGLYVAIWLLFQLYKIARGLFTGKYE